MNTSHSVKHASKLKMIYFKYIMCGHQIEDSFHFLVVAKKHFRRYSKADMMTWILEINA